MILALLTVGIVVRARSIAAPVTPFDASGPDVERQLEVGQFSAVQLRGAWEVELTRAPEYRAVLVGPQGVVEAAEVSTAGGRLVIRLSGAVDIGRAPRVIITAPTVAEVSVAGAIDGRVVGLDAARLKVAATGAAEQSARLDGAGHFRVLFELFIPLAISAIATVTLFSIIYHWNSWFDGLIFISHVKKQPLQTYLQSLLNSYDSIVSLEQAERSAKVGQRSLMYARLLIAIVPIAVIYPFMQKYFKKGIVLGSVKA